MPLLLAFGAQLVLGESCSYESGFALPPCDTKGALQFSLPPWFLVWLMVVSRRSGGCMLRMLRSRSLVLFCVHVGGFVLDARARLLCLFAVFGRSVGWSWCLLFCLVLLCLIFLRLLGPCHFCFCLFVLDFVMFLFFYDAFPYVSDVAVLRLSLFVLFPLFSSLSPLVSLFLFFPLSLSVFCRSFCRPSCSLSLVLASRRE